MSDEKVINFKKAKDSFESSEVIKKRFIYSGCQHGKYYVNESLTSLECRLCGKDVNPIWALCDTVEKQSRYFKKALWAKEALEKIQKRIRTKCQHCKKMTRINGF